MQNLIESINTFTNEWIMLISFVLILMLSIVLFLSCGWYHSSKQYRTRLVEKINSYDDLNKTHQLYEKIVRAFMTAIEGCKRFRTDPDSWLKKIDEVDLKFWSETFGKNAIFQYKTSIDDVRSIINFIFRLKSANLILEEAMEAVTSSYKYYDSDDDTTTFDISRLAEDYIENITTAANQLSILNMEEFKDQLIRSAEKSIKPLIYEGQINQAKHLINEMELGHPTLNLDMVAEFAEQCERSSADPISFLDPDNEKHTAENLNAVLEAVRLIKQQAEPPTVEPEKKQNQPS